MVGRDFPDSFRSWLLESQVDTAGLLVEPERPTPRAWQITEEDGLRTQVRGYPTLIATTMRSTTS